jgi:hypothetical protein
MQCVTLSYNDDLSQIRLGKLIGSTIATSNYTPTTPETQGVGKDHLVPLLQVQQGGGGVAPSY